MSLFGSYINFVLHEPTLQMMSIRVFKGVQGQDIYDKHLVKMADDAYDWSI